MGINVKVQCVLNNAARLGVQLETHADAEEMLICWQQTSKKKRVSDDPEAARCVCVACGSPKLAKLQTRPEVRSACK